MMAPKKRKHLILGYTKCYNEFIIKNVSSVINSLDRHNFSLIGFFSLKCLLMFILSTRWGNDITQAHQG